MIHNAVMAIRKYRQSVVSISGLTTLGGIAMSNVPELYGSMVFNEHVMRERLPKDTFKQLMKTVKENQTARREYCEIAKEIADFEEKNIEKLKAYLK